MNRNKLGEIFEAVLSPNKEGIIEVYLGGTIEERWEAYNELKEYLISRMEEYGKE